LLCLCARREPFHVAGYLGYEKYERKLITGGRNFAYLFVVTNCCTIESPHTITLLLRKHEDGDRGAFRELLPLVYSQLRRTAAALMRSSPSNQTLQPTALVHEAFLKMSTGEEFTVTSRAHFMALASRVMRQILVDHARSRASGRRGGGRAAVTLEEGIMCAPERAPSLLALDSALEALAKLDQRKARIIEMRYFGGLTGEEIAGVIGVGTATVTRDLRTAEAWLGRELSRASL